MAVQEPAEAMSRHDGPMDVADLRRDMTTFIALLFMVVSGFALWLILPGPLFLRPPFYILCLFFFTMLGALLARARIPWLSSALLLFGPTFSLAMAMELLGYASLPYLAVLAVMANAAVDPRLGVVAAVLNSATSLIFAQTLETRLVVLILIWLTFGIQLIASRSLFAALGWAWNSQRSVTNLLEQLRTRQGRLNRTLAALTEATRRLEHTNRELIIARQEAHEARAVKEQLVANVSHELRTPLNLIVGFAEMMYANPESYKDVCWTPELESDIGEIYLASRHLQSLVNDILDLVRIDAAHLPMFREMADIRTIVDDAAATVASLFRQRGLWLRVDKPESLPELFVDRTRIRQVMLNLLNNAVRFTDEGGVTVRVEQDEEAVVISVQDTGVGIPPDQLESIFEEFCQVQAGPRSRGGTGLGLALSRQFVTLHGGRMWVESKVGAGSTFYFSLPLPESTPQATILRRTPDSWRADWSHAPLLVVDQDPRIAEMLSRYMDHPTLTARSLDEAESLVEATHPVGIVVNQTPDAPPEAWLGTIGPLSECYGVPVLRCSIPSPSWLRLSSSLDDCLTKPVTREVLLDTIRRHCTQPARILVVDDNAGFVSLMQRMLDHSPLVREVLSAYSGAEALRIAREKIPDLVFLDLLMPDIDGFVVLDALRSDLALKDTWVVAVTATSYAEEILMRRASYFTLTCTRGLSASTITEFLKIAINKVHPDYLRDDSARSIA